MRPHPNPASSLVANALAAMLIDAAAPGAQAPVSFENLHRAGLRLSRFRRNHLALSGSWLEARQGT